MSSEDTKYDAPFLDERMCSKQRGTGTGGGKDCQAAEDENRGSLRGGWQLQGLVEHVGGTWRRCVGAVAAIFRFGGGGD